MGRDVGDMTIGLHASSRRSGQTSAGGSNANSVTKLWTTGARQRRLPRRFFFGADDGGKYARVSCLWRASLIGARAFHKRPILKFFLSRCTRAGQLLFSPTAWVLKGVEDGNYG